ncbi:hypothetical protein MTP99_003986 [Tenebrio molitor]|nr:hypothetical protein MTP99_003986 [Tenebrio molitor]
MGKKFNKLDLRINSAKHVQRTKTIHHKDLKVETCGLCRDRSGYGMCYGSRPVKISWSQVTTGSSGRVMGKTSSVWKYFTKRRDGFANCNLCGKKLKTSGNTTNLLGHVSRMHKNHVAEDVKTAEEVNQNKSTNNEIEPESNQGATSADTNNNMSNPLEVLTKEVSADKYVTISKIIPMVHCLKSELDNQQTDSPEVINLKQSLSSEIHKRFGKMEHVETLAISTLLDPRFKKLHFKDYVAVGNSILVIKRKLEKLFAVDNVDNQMESSPIEEEIEKEMDLWKLHKTMVAEHQNKGTSEDDIKNIINAEVSQYINSPVLHTHIYISLPSNIYRFVQLQYLQRGCFRRLGKS